MLKGNAFPVLSAINTLKTKLYDSLHEIENIYIIDTMLFILWRFYFQAGFPVQPVHVNNS